MLPADAARAWWPFLVLSIACYGLLLRAALWLSIALAQRRRLQALRFDDPAAHALWRRLAGPLVRAEGGAAQLPAGTATAAPRSPVGDCVVLVALELSGDDDSLRASLHTRFGCVPSAWRRIALDDRAASAPALAEIAARRPLPASVLIVAPAQRDPIVAIALMLRAVAQAAAPGAELLLLLTAADEARLAIWRRFVQIQHLPIGVEAWG
jgi:hypothetical protein